MDFTKMNIPTLDGPNWGTYSIHLQAAAQILGFWEIIKGEALAMMPVTYNFYHNPPQPLILTLKILPLLRQIGTEEMEELWA